ncbi:MAG: hypothetical protein WA231_08820 [Methylocella sp.]
MNEPSRVLAIEARGFEVSYFALKRASPADRSHLDERTKLGAAPERLK